MHAAAVKPMASRPMILPCKARTRNRTQGLHLHCMQCKTSSAGPAVATAIMHGRPASTSKRNHRFIDPSKMSSTPFHSIRHLLAFTVKYSHSTTCFVLSDAHKGIIHDNLSKKRERIIHDPSISKHTQNAHHLQAIQRSRLQNYFSAICALCSCGSSIHNPFAETREDATQN